METEVNKQTNLQRVVTHSFLPINNESGIWAMKLVCGKHVPQAVMELSLSLTASVQLGLYFLEVSY